MPVLTPVSPPVLVAIIMAFLALLAVTGYLVVRPRMLRWGATPVEAGQALAGDELIPDPILATTRAIDINVGPERVWPWLAQLGQGRGGFYSYEWLENLAGLDIHNSDRIIPELQNLKPGDLVPFWRGAGVGRREAARQLERREPRPVKDFVRVGVTDPIHDVWIGQGPLEGSVLLPQRSPKGIW